MTDLLYVLLLLALAAWAIAASVWCVRLRRRAIVATDMAIENARKHDNLMNLLAAAVLAKGGTLRIPCRAPNWEAPGVNIVRKGNEYTVTVSGGPHMKGDSQ